MRTTLLLRGVVGVVFGIRLLSDAASDWHRMFDVLAQYLIVDGVLGAIVGASLFLDSTSGDRRHLRSLAVVMLIDAAGRMASGVSVYVWPGIPGFPLTAVIFIALMAIFTGMVGFSEAALIAEEAVARVGPNHARPQFPIPPVLLSSVASIGFGIAAIVYLGDATLVRSLVGGYVIAAGGVFLAMAWTRRGPEAQTAHSP